MKSEITPLILTYNEEANIARTLAALSWAKQIVIVDSGSTDDTLELAREAHPNIRVFTRSFDTHANQWNFGLQQIQTEWVLTLDADYEVSPELADEIQSLNPGLEIVGYKTEFEYRIRGRSLRASVYPPRIVLFRPQDASYFDDGHTQRLRTNGTVEKLNGKIYHDDRKSFHQWLEAQKRYTKLEAKHLCATPFSELIAADRLRRLIFPAAPMIFLYLLIGRGLILDGWPGWVYVGQRTIAEILLSYRLILEGMRQS